MSKPFLCMTSSRKLINKLKMKSKQENKKERELRLKAQMKENLLKRKKQVKLKINSKNTSMPPHLLGKGGSNG